MIVADDGVVAEEKYVITPSSSTPCAKRKTLGRCNFNSGLQKSRLAGLSNVIRLAENLQKIYLIAGSVIFPGSQDVGYVQSRPVSACLILELEVNVQVHRDMTT